MARREGKKDEKDFYDKLVHGGLNNCIFGKLSHGRTGDVKVFRLASDRGCLE